jgi:hypothetical protein
VKRVLRLLLNAVTGLSLVLCLAALGLWGSSEAYGRPPTYSRTVGVQYQSIVLYRGALQWDRRTQLVPDDEQPAGPVTVRTRWRHGAPGVAVMSYDSVSYENPSSPPLARTTAVYLELWLASVLTGIFPAVWAVRRRSAIAGFVFTLARGRRWTRHEGARCPSCGYDLRATPDRCPECGTTPTTTATPKAAAQQPGTAAPQQDARPGGAGG